MSSLRITTSATIATPSLPLQSNRSRALSNVVKSRVADPLRYPSSIFPRVLLAILFITAGTLHFLIPQTYVRIMPPYFPAHLLLVHISGACEILGGLGLFFQPPIRTLAAWGLVALLIAVMPANIYMATNRASYPAIPAWALYLRLPLQLPLIWWAWLYTRR